MDDGYVGEVLVCFVLGSLYHYYLFATTTTKSRGVWIRHESAL